MNVVATRNRSAIVAVAVSVTCDKILKGMEAGGTISERRIGLRNWDVAFRFEPN